MILLKSPEEVEKMRAASLVVAAVLATLRKMSEPGISTAELDQEAEALIRKRGGKPAFKGYRGYPATICASINEEVVHGIPKKRKLKSGDLVSIDMGVIKDGYFGDGAITIPIGIVSETAAKLVRVAEESLQKAVDVACSGGRLHDISAAVQAHTEAAGYSVVREFVGHGIGTALHEEPQVPNFGKAGTGMKLEPGLVLAIEPMINEGGPEVRILEDGWTAVTVDGRLSAHFEHCVAITKDGPVVLTKTENG